MNEWKMPEWMREIYLHFDWEDDEESYNGKYGDEYQEEIQEFVAILESLRTADLLFTPTETKNIEGNVAELRKRILELEKHIDGLHREILDVENILNANHSPDPSPQGANKRPRGVDNENKT